MRGVTPDSFRNRALIKQHIVEGDLAAFDGDKIVIGQRMAQRLGLHAGDSLTLISPTSKSTVFGNAPRMRAYKSPPSSMSVCSI